MSVLGWSVEALLPHRPPMVLLDSVQIVQATHAVATVRIAEDNVFYTPGIGVPVWVGLEFMAQTVGLTAGFRARDAGQAVKIGFLLGSRRFDSMVSAFPLGYELTIKADEVWYDGQMAVFDCVILDQSADPTAVFAKAQLNVFQPSDPAEFLREKGL